MISSLCRTSRSMNKRSLSRRVGEWHFSTFVDYQANVKELEEQGYSVLKNVFSAAEISKMNSDYKRLREKAMSIISTNANQRDRVWKENNETTYSKYWCQPVSKESDKHDVILQAGVGRYDLWKGFHLNVESTVLDNLMNTLLNTHTHYSGIVLSTPGSSDQYWHRDVDNLSNSGDTSGVALMNIDDFYFTLLIPCSVDVTLDNGPTEFMVKSHRATSDEFHKLEKRKACLNVGDVLIFNGKMNHRGLGNRTGEKDGDEGEERPVVYKIYHRPWYSDNYRAGVAED